MTYQLLIVHCDPSVGPRYKDTLAAVGVDATVTAFVAPGPGLSSKYDTLAAVAAAKAHTAPESFLAERGDVLAGLELLGYFTRDPSKDLVVAFFSAGYALARHFTLNDRRKCRGLAFIDSGHSDLDADGTASDKGVAWAAELAKMARNGELALGFGHTDVEPTTYASTTKFGAEMVRLSQRDMADGMRAVPISQEDRAQGLVSREYSGKLLVESWNRQPASRAAQEHRDSLTVWGAGLVYRVMVLASPAAGEPEATWNVLESLRDVWHAFETYFAGWRRNVVGEPGNVTIALTDLGVAELPGAKDTPRIQHMHEITDELGAGEHDEVSWCASASSCWMVEGQAPETWPHTPTCRCWRAIQSARERGTWYEAKAGGGLAVCPPPGSRVVYKRAGGDPRIPGQPGHIVTVIGRGARVPCSCLSDRCRSTVATFDGIAGNESNRVRRADRPLEDPEIVGWIAPTRSVPQVSA